VITIITYVILAHYELGPLPGSFMFEKICEIASALNVFALGFCSFLLVKVTWENKIE
jgi:hypothetical protein